MCIITQKIYNIQKPLDYQFYLHILPKDVIIKGLYPLRNMGQSHTTRISLRHILPVFWHVDWVRINLRLGFWLLRAHPSPDAVVKSNLRFEQRGAITVYILPAPLSVTEKVKTYPSQVSTTLRLLFLFKDVFGTQFPLKFSHF